MTAGIAAEEPVVVDTVGIGQLLRKGRTQKSMSVDDLARELHLQVRQVDALERGDFSGFSSPAFVKGHLRACARLFALDGDALVQSYEAGLPQPKAFTPAPPVLAAKIVRMPGQRNRSGLMIAGFILVLLLLVMWFWLGRPNWGGITFQAVATEPAVSAVTAMSSSDALPLPEVMPVLGDSPAAAPDGQPAADMPVAVNQATVDLTGSPAPDVPGAGPDEGPVLHLEFMDDCWVQLKADDGKVLHEKLHKKGESLDMVVTTPLHVWFGKAGAVNASYNGVVVSVPVKPGFQSARFVLGDESSPGEFE